MLTINQGIRLSAIIEKIDIEINPELTQEQLGASLVKQVVSKAYKAGNEIKAFVAETKGCSIEEAGKVDLIEFFKDLVADTGIKDFFTSALKLQPPG